MAEIKLVEMIEDEYGGNMYYFDIFTNEETVGSVSVTAHGYDDPHAYVERIDVDEEFRNHGYGTSALEQISEMWDGVEIAPDNEDAQRLYARLGWESTWDAADVLDQGFGVYRI